jgi:hypothetical protein
MPHSLQVMQTIYSAEQSERSGGDTGVRLVRMTLDHPESRIAVRAPDATLGRAEAVLEGAEARSWAAKHFWHEGPPGDQIAVYEFEEPLPAGPVLLRIPFQPFVPAR